MVFILLLHVAMSGIFSLKASVTFWFTKHIGNGALHVKNKVRTKHPVGFGSSSALCGGFIGGSALHRLAEALE
ncbi:hypothetical protein A9Q83_10045 [Alphaproteobacteria bacterium 46_93_T64]|nr:hypothetical protein A9Q83_10045 [Alphaproteobacteria bacterium 46_93_T64]